MNTRIATIAGFVSLLATAAGCARPAVVPAAASPSPVVDYAVPAAALAPGDRSARSERSTLQTRVALVNVTTPYEAARIDRDSHHHGR
jgi:hypothetical protein